MQYVEGFTELLTIDEWVALALDIPWLGATHLHVASQLRQLPEGQTPESLLAAVPSALGTLCQALAIRIARDEGDESVGD